MLISVEDYQYLKKEYGSDFEALIGGKALYELLKEVNVKKVARNIRKNLEENKGGKGQLLRWRRRLKVIEEFVNSENEPQNMMLTCVPVIPPDLRPLVPLKGGKFASSDLNDLYRRIINRNNRLRQISEMGAPTVMLHNEKRLLQEAVDALIQNGARGKVVTGTGNRPLKCLSDTIKGKQGRFRRNLRGGQGRGSKIKRHKKIIVEYKDENGIFKKEEFEGDLSELFQHEIDHLDGILATDYLKNNKDIILREEWEKLRN